MHPAALAGGADRPIARHATPSGARTERGDRRFSRGSLGGDGCDHRCGEWQIVARDHTASGARSRRGSLAESDLAGNGTRNPHVTARRAALLTSGAMLLVYIATLAPGVTFWDAGEFISAARVLGIPHPPGTPLFVVLLNVWARAFPFLSYAAATNLFSAACTAASLGLVVFWLARSTNTTWIVIGAAVTAGTMSSVWLNATETEVYAA